MTRGKFAGLALLIIGACDLALLASDRRILVWETRLPAGGDATVSGWGKIGGADQDQLICRYFTGRSVKANVMWYSASNVLGRDQCPFIASGA